MQFDCLYLSLFFEHYNHSQSLYNDHATIAFYLVNESSNCTWLKSSAFYLVNTIAFYLVNVI